MYIVIEGLDGCGKSTLCKEIAMLTDFALTYEPYGGDDLPECKALRKMALSKDSKITANAREAMLLANRSIHFEYLVRPLLETGSVISDRSFISGLAYARTHGFSTEKWVQWFTEIVPNYQYPNLIVRVVNDEHKVNDPDSIYDDRDAKFRTQLSKYYDEALEYFGFIKQVTFQNSFQRPVEENARLLMQQVGGLWTSPS
jgi:thymidylate kinase